MIIQNKTNTEKYIQICPDDECITLICFINLFQYMSNSLYVAFDTVP